MSLRAERWENPQRREVTATSRVLAMAGETLTLDPGRAPAAGKIAAPTPWFQGISICTLTLVGFIWQA